MQNLIITAAQHTNFIIPRDLGTPKTLSGKRWKFRDSGLPIKEYSNVKKTADPGNSGKFILGIPNGHFGMIFLGG